jgi:uncharacterized membrane protein
MMNLVFCITNLIKGGSRANKLYFQEQGCIWKFLMYILESEDLKFIEMCVHSIKEIASFKVTLGHLMNKEDASQFTALKKVLVKCFNLTDDWIKFIKEGTGDQRMKSYLMSNESDQTYDSINQSDLNVMTNMVEKEGDTKRSILFASKSILIRNNIYYTISRCIKVSFDFNLRF